MQGQIPQGAWGSLKHAGISDLLYSIQHICPPSFNITVYLFVWWEHKRNSITDQNSIVLAKQTVSNRLFSIWYDNRQTECPVTSTLPNFITKPLLYTVWREESFTQMHMVCIEAVKSVHCCHRYVMWIVLQAPPLHWRCFSAFHSSKQLGRVALFSTGFGKAYQ